MSEPHFHWFLPTTYDSRDVMPSGSNYRAPDIGYLADVARAAERNGFESLLAPTGHQCEDAWLVTAALTTLTDRIKFLIAFRPGNLLPTLAAQMAASFQKLSNNRLAINIVTGGNDTDQRAYGDFLDKDSRYARTNEFLQVLKLCWDGKGKSYDGAFYKFENGGNDTPLEHRPKIFFGGASHAAQAVAARHVDVQLMFGEPPAMAGERIGAMRERARAAGREIEFGIRIHVVTRDTEDAAWREAERLLYNMDFDFVRKQQGRIEKSQAVGQQRIIDAKKNLKIDIDAMESGRFDVRSLQLHPNIWAGTGLLRGGGGSTALVGSHAQIAERIREYQSVGIDHFILSGYPKIEESYWFGENVMPLFRSREVNRPLASVAGQSI
ncbi:LLM class flavin-dependent oxidoreductase [Brucella pituitosa]|uniref:LLM class flavin-dependent oxidoreductase n=1 Tax=Brucella pituitosa TaxID=571256 RepID=UPI000D010BCD|nr:alkanesulfonate monooxygenase [Ochrobactrum sp. MYb68]